MNTHEHESDVPPADLTPLSQSVWFWVHAFTVFCLAVLLVRGDKIVALRTQRSENSQMRATVSGQADTVEDEQAVLETERTWLLGGYLFFGIIAVISWWQVWRTVLRPKLAAARIANRPHSSHQP